jgi:hypothetical protein
MSGLVDLEEDKYSGPEPARWQLAISPTGVQAVQPVGEITTENYLNALAAVVDFGIDDPSCAIPLSPSS